jgi:cell division protein FtsZ
VKRRQFNQVMVALSAITSLSALANATNASTKPLLKQEGEDCPICVGLVTVGGADGNSVAAIAHGLPYVACTIAIDRDSAALDNSGADRMVLIGDGYAGPMKSRSAFEMTRKKTHEIEAVIGDLDLVFIIAGMYGATGTGIAPVVADVARRRDIATIGVAITPTGWRGSQSNPRIRYAVREFRLAGATVLPTPSKYRGHALDNEGNAVSETIKNLFTTVGHSISQFQLLGIDFDDLQLVLNPGGIAAMGLGSAEGIGRAETAAHQATDHPLLGKDHLRNATGVLVNTRGKATCVTLAEVKTMTGLIRRSAPLDSTLLYSASIDDSVGEQLVVSILASTPSEEARMLI